MRPVGFSLWSMKSGREQLKDWMGRRGLNQTETAGHFGWDITFISQLVNGRRLPGLTNAVKIERETGIPVEAWLPNELDNGQSGKPDPAGVAR
jgi:transcriptional regulator with XRE-family HTH domain